MTSMMIATKTEFPLDEMQSILCASFPNWSVKHRPPNGVEVCKGVVTVRLATFKHGKPRCIVYLQGVSGVYIYGDLMESFEEAVSDMLDQLRNCFPNIV